MRWIIKEFLWGGSRNANKCRNKQTKKGRLDRDIIVTRYQPLYNPSLSVSLWLFFFQLWAIMLNIKQLSLSSVCSVNIYYILYFQSDWHHLSNISRFAWKMLSFVILCCGEHGTIKLYMKFFVHCSVKENYLYSELYVLPRQFQIEYFLGYARGRGGIHCKGRMLWGAVSCPN